MFLVYRVPTYSFRTITSFCNQIRLSLKHNGKTDDVKLKNKNL